MFLVILLYAILASTFIFAKKTLIYAQPFFLIGLRMIIAGILLLSYQWFAHRKSFNIKKNDWGIFVRVALFHIYFVFTLEFWALQYVSALKTTIIFSATPFITAFLSYFLLRERLTYKKIIGVCIGLAGLLPVIFSQAKNEQHTFEWASISLPDIVLVLAVISASYAWFIVMELIQKGYKLIFINGIAMLVGGIVSLITSFFIEGVHYPIKELWPFLGWLSLLIISANIIVYNFYGWLLKRYSITFLSFAGFLCPCFASLYEWLFWGGVITWNYFISLFLVVIGLSLFYQDELTKKII